MGMEIEFMTFSTFIFGAFILIACLKPLRGSYLAQEVVQQKMTKQQRYREKKAFSQELEDITTNFESRFQDALRGELK